MLLLQVGVISLALMLATATAAAASAAPAEGQVRVPLQLLYMRHVSQRHCSPPTGLLGSRWTPPACLQPSLASFALLLQ